jgi:hypothetical protein
MPLGHQGIKLCHKKSIKMPVKINAINWVYSELSQTADSKKIANAEREKTVVAYAKVYNKVWQFYFVIN